MKLDPERTEDLDDGGKAWVSVFRKKIVEALTAEARLRCEISHTFGACHYAESMGQEHGIPILKNGVNIRCNLLCAPQICGTIPGYGFDRHLSKLRCQLDRLCDVTSLAVLVAACQQHNQLAASRYEIHAISRAIIYS